MSKNRDLNSLLARAQQLSGLRYKKDVIELALKEFIQRREQLEIFKVFHTIPYYADYNSKLGRLKR